MLKECLLLEKTSFLTLVKIKNIIWSLIDLCCVWETQGENQIKSIYFVWGVQMNKCFFFFSNIKLVMTYKSQTKSLRWPLSDSSSVGFIAENAWWRHHPTKRRSNELSLSSFMAISHIAWWNLIQKHEEDRKQQSLTFLVR